MAGQDELIYRVVYESDEASFKAVQAQLNALTQQTAQQMQKAQMEALKGGAGVQGLKAIEDIAKNARQGVMGMVDLSRKIEETKTELKKLSEEQKKNGSLTDEQARSQVELKASLSATQTAYRDAERDLVALSQAGGAVASTYNDLVRENKALSAELRNIPLDDTTGRLKTLQEQYKANNDKLKAFDATLGNHQRNVGNYSEAIKNAAGELNIFGQPVGMVTSQITAQFKAAKDAQGGMGGLTAGFKAFNTVAKANIVFLIASAFVSLANALSTVQPIMDAVNRATSRFSGAFQGLIKTIVDGGSLFDNIKKSSEASVALLDNQKKLFTAETAVISMRAKSLQQVEELKNIAKDESVSITERINALEYANALLDKIATAERKIALQRVNDAKTAAKFATDKREADRAVAEAEANLAEVDANLFQRKREQLEQINTLRTKEKAQVIELKNLELDAIDAVNQKNVAALDTRRASFQQLKNIALDEFRQARESIKARATAEEAAARLTITNEELLAQKIKQIRAQRDADVLIAYQQFSQKETEIDRNRMMQRIDMANMTATGINDIAQGLSAVGLLSAKRAFQVQKAADASQATTAGILAVQKAIAINPVPPYPLAILAGAATLANVTRILATPFGGSGGADVSPRSSGLSTAAAASAPTASGFSTGNISVASQVAASASPSASTAPTIVVNNMVDRSGIATLVREGNDEISTRGITANSFAA